ncbi:hypothetical protein ABZZ04_21160 [Streptomyces sp. NPDC006435]|uniref:hypothetical protein n=1 Tax=Streptomyces sp. NPDC006435 TaxID=3154300 RepID=UPI0033BED168
MTLLSRDTERTQLDDALTACGRGGTGIVLVKGAVGCGKIDDSQGTGDSEGSRGSGGFGGSGGSGGFDDLDGFDRGWVVPVLREAAQQAMAVDEPERAATCLQLAHASCATDTDGHTRSEIMLQLATITWRLSPAAARRPVPGAVDRGEADAACRVRAQDLGRRGRGPVQGASPASSTA